MHKTLILAAMLAAISSVLAQASAADILVITPGSAGEGLRALAADWAAATGNKATIQTGSSGPIRDSVAGGAVCDLVVLPPSEFKAIAGVIKGETVTFVGTIPMAAVVKSGTPHPDISNLDKFIGLLKQTGVGYADPVRGSTSGGQVAKMLTRPEFTGVKGIITQGAPANAVARGEVTLGIGTLSEDKIPGVDVIGHVPVELGMKLDISTAVCNKASAPSEAQAFIKFITRSDAAASWGKGSLVLPKK
jgi:molybdate transport system substrate-binding protein